MAIDDKGYFTYGAYQTDRPDAYRVAGLPEIPDLPTDPRALFELTQAYKEGKFKPVTETVQKTRTFEDFIRGEGGDLPIAFATKEESDLYDKLMEERREAKKAAKLTRFGQLADLALGGSGVIAAGTAGLATGDIEDALKAGVEAYGVEKLGSLGLEKLGLKGIEKELAEKTGLKNLEGKGKMALRNLFSGGDDSVTVKPGDTLSAIAKKAGVTLDELKAANPNITDINKIDVGQTINIPGQGGFLSSVADFLTPDKTEGQSTLGLIEDYFKGKLSESSPVRPDSFLSGVGQTIQGGMDYLPKKPGGMDGSILPSETAAGGIGGLGGLGGLLAGGAGLLALKELLGEKAEATAVGGGFDPTISPVMEQIMSEAQKSYLEGPRQYDPTERFAFFTPEEQLARQRTAMLAQPGMDPYQAQQAELLGLAGGALGDYQRRLEQQYAPLGTAAEQYKEAAGVARGAARGLDVADLDIQKFMDPYQQAVTDIAKREAIEESEKRQRDIGAAAAKAGAFGGSRMALLEAEEASGLGERLADIQARGSAEAYRQALGAAERERELGLGVEERGLGREATLAQQLASLGGASVGLSGAYGAAASPFGGISGQLTGLAGQYGQLGGDIFGRERAKVGMLADVGREGRGLEQQRRDFAYGQFQAADPFARLGQFGAALSPVTSQVRQTQYIPQQTNLQQLAGLATLFANQGGTIKRQDGGNMSNRTDPRILMAQQTDEPQPSEPKTPLQEVATQAPAQLSNNPKANSILDSVRNFIKSMYPDEAQQKKAGLLMLLNEPEKIGASALSGIAKSILGAQTLTEERELKERELAAKERAAGMLDIGNIPTMYQTQAKNAYGSYMGDKQSQADFAERYNRAVNQAIGEAKDVAAGRVIDETSSLYGLTRPTEDQIGARTVQIFREKYYRLNKPPADPDSGNQSVPADSPSLSGRARRQQKRNSDALVGEVLKQADY